MYTVLVLLPLSVMFADASGTSPAKITKSDTVFLAAILHAFQKRDLQWIARRMVYPLSFVEGNETCIVTNKDQFLPILDREVTESFVADLQSEAGKPLFKNWEGVAVGGGTMWFAEYKHEGDRSWNYGIWAIRPFALQPSQPRIWLEQGVGGTNPAGKPMLIKPPSCVLETNRMVLLKHEIAEADRICVSGWFDSYHYNLTLSNDATAQVINAVSSAKPSPPTASIFDLSLEFYRSTNFLGRVDIAGSHFQLYPRNEHHFVSYYAPDGTSQSVEFWDVDEFCDDSGVLDRLYRDYDEHVSAFAQHEVAAAIASKIQFKQKLGPGQR